MKETKNELNAKPSQCDYIHKLTTHTQFSTTKKWDKRFIYILILGVYNVHKNNHRKNASS
jgi:hypothetical protein